MFLHDEEIRAAIAHKDSVRILLSEDCNARCPNCFNTLMRSGRHMDYGSYLELITYLAENGLTSLKIMGGEPTIHPDFFRAVQKAQQLFPRVFIFTNALNDKITQIQPRDQDAIIYNFSFINRQFDFDKILAQWPGERLFEVQITSKTDVKDLKDRLSLVNEKVPSDRIKVSLTLDCTEDIFLEKDLIITKWNAVVDHLIINLNAWFHNDHSIPWCFFHSTNMQLKKERRPCNIFCAGLIDADLNLRHCNQMVGRTIIIKNSDGFIPYEELIKYLWVMNYEKIEGNRNKICGECKLSPSVCNGGCFIHKDCVSASNLEPIRQ